MGERQKRSPATNHKLSADKDANSASVLPADYAELLDDIKQRIAAARVKAALAVNRDLIELYWDIDGLIVERQQRDGWGAGVVQRLGRDIQAALPWNYRVLTQQSGTHAIVPSCLPARTCNFRTGRAEISPTGRIEPHRGSPCQFSHSLCEN